jgi:hypothetical protein
MKELGPIFNRLTDVAQCPRGSVEDYYVQNFKAPSKGFFVECGAGNGLIQTNTAYLDRKLGWSGILIESHDLLFSELEKNRSHERVKCVHETVGAHGKEVMFNEIVFDGSAGSQYLGWSAVVDKGGRFAKKKKSKSITAVLQENNAPRVIDYCVIDVESAYDEVVSNLDLDAFHIKLLAVEFKPPGRYCDLVNRILSKGYSLRHIIPEGHDYIFEKA